MNRYTVEMAFDATEDLFNEIMEVVADMVMGQPNGVIVSSASPIGGQATGIRTMISRPAVCPECRQGKCGNCDGQAMDDSDNIVECQCIGVWHAAP